MTKTLENSVKDSNKTNDVIALLIFTLYFLIDFVPLVPMYSKAEPQWLYWNVLNIAVLAFLLYDKTFLENLKIHFLKSSLFLCYATFITVSGISLVVALNIFEGIVNFGRYLTGFVCLINLYVLFYKRGHLFLYIASILSIFLGIQSFIGLNQIIDQYGKMNYNTSIYITNFTHGNKNVFSAILLTKIPFVLYSLLHTSNWKKYFYFVIFCMSSLLLFLLSTRALIIGYILYFIIFFSLSFWLKLATFKKNCTLLVSIILLFGLSIIIIKNGDVKVIGQKTDSEVLNRNLDISAKDASLQLRFNYWKGGLKTIKEKPLLGCGIGSWKIESLKEEHKWKTTSSIGIHMHNDFLEVFAENGIFAGITFLSLFFFTGFFYLKNIITTTNNKSKEQKIVYTILFMSFIGYGVDSFFNFPLNRPTTHIVFSFLLFFTLILKNDGQKVAITNTPLKTLPFYIVLLFVSIASIYPNVLQHKFYKYYNTIQLDNTKHALTYDEIKKNLPKYPNILFTGTSIEAEIASYLIREEKYELADQALNKAIRVNPLSLLAYSNKAILGSELKNNDSVLKYNKIKFYRAPNFYVHYKTYLQNVSIRKDTTEILKAFNLLNKETINPDFYKSTYEYLKKCDVSKKSKITILEEGLRLFKGDSTLLSLKKEVETNKIEKTTTSNAASFNTTNKSLAKKVVGFRVKVDDNVNNESFKKMLPGFLTQIKNNPNDPILNKNVGICYYKTNAFAKAIPYMNKVLASGKYTDGEIEFILAISYFNTNQDKKGCEFATICSQKGYNKKNIDNVIASLCK